MSDALQDGARVTLERLGVGPDDRFLVVSNPAGATIVTTDDGGAAQMRWTSPVRTTAWRAAGGTADPVVCGDGSTMAGMVSIFTPQRKSIVCFIAATFALPTVVLPWNWLSVFFLST